MNLNNLKVTILEEV